MKKFKKVIPALCMLLVSAIMLGSTTYAWFSMNTTVNATGMQVTAKSNAVYLLINNENVAGNTATGLSDTTAAKYVDATNTSKTVYPVKYFASATEKSKIGNVELEDAAGYSSDTWIGTNKWFTANNANSASATDNVKNINLITEGDDKYMLEYNVWLTLSKDSEAVNDQKVKVSLTGTSADAAVKAVVVINDEHLALTQSGNATTTSNVAISSESAVKVTIFVYIDGDSTNVNSNYINTGSNSITGTLGLTFDLVSE